MEPAPCCNPYAELETLKASRAALVEHEQRTRNQCNRLRGQLKESKSMLDWAETLLCNVVPMPHCSQAEWDSLVKKWRDEKHILFPDGKDKA